MENDKIALLIKKLKLADTKILVADGDEVSQIAIATLFSMIQLQCDFTNNGKDAVELAQKNQYNIIFLDCLLPIINGFETSIKIRQFELSSNTSPTKIIALCAHSSTENRIKSIQSGMDIFIYKPMRFATLINLLESTLS